MNLQIIKLNNKEYYLSNEIFVYDPSFFPGCQTNTRLMITKKKLNNDDYTFGYIKNKEWILSKDTYARSKLLLSSEWVENNVPKIIINKKKLLNEINNNNVIIDDHTDTIDIDNLYDAPPAPNILELEDNEMFKDSKGGVLNIEVRGERNHKKCYFKVKDVSEAFEMPNLNSSLLHKNNINETNNKYMMNTHWKYFTVSKMGDPHFYKTKKELYLTYNGILKVLFSSSSGNAEQFQDWATETLFTVQMGTKEQKQELASNLIGVHVNVVKQVFNKNISTIPCIYLFSLNKVSKLRKTLNISNEYDDDMIICKFGCTEDIERRMKEHNSNYGKLDGVNLELLMFSYIEPKFIFEAETSVNDFLNKYKLINDNYNELVIINQKDLKMVKRHYEMVQNSYSGHIKELLIKMKNLENKINIQELQHKNELQEVQHKNDLLMKENEYIKREKELLLKIYELSNK
jgi:hypothetical protein